MLRSELCGFGCRQVVAEVGAGVGLGARRRGLQRHDRHAEGPGAHLQPMALQRCAGRLTLFGLLCAASAWRAFADTKSSKDGPGQYIMFTMVPYSAFV